MARKVFISFLGTSNYVNCHYMIEGKKTPAVRFIQEALIRQVCQDWGERDKILVFCTSEEKTGSKGSKELNWEDDGQTHTFEEIEKIGLTHRLEDLKLQGIIKAKVQSIDIVAGFSESEIWDIFNTVYNELDSFDQIYFDATHAFRSIPMFSIVLFNYAKFMKNTNLNAVYYGAFEKLGFAFEVRNLPLDERVAPVLNLTNIALLQEYNQVASELKYYGKVRKLRDLVDLPDKESFGIAISQLAKSIEEIDEYIETIDLKNLQRGGYVSNFRGNNSFLKRKKLFPKPIADILEELSNQLSEFDGSPNTKNIEAAIHWTKNHNMLMQTFALSAEYVIWRIAEIFSAYKPKKLSGKEFRELIGGILGVPDEDFIIRRWKGLSADYPHVANKIASFPFVKELRISYDKIRKYRNSMVHGNGSYTYETLKDEGVHEIGACIKIIDDIHVEVNPSDIDDNKMKRLFVNISNHPYENWSSNQKEKAQLFGDLTEIPFPAVSPDVSDKEVGKMADQYVQHILELATNAQVTVHIMGEMTLTYAIVNRLKAAGINCIASTNIRNVVMDGEKKISEFEFIRFRNY